MVWSHYNSYIYALCAVAACFVLVFPAVFFPHFLSHAPSLFVCLCSREWFTGSCFSRDAPVQHQTHQLPLHDPGLFPTPALTDWWLYLHSRYPLVLIFPSHACAFPLSTCAGPHRLSAQLQLHPARLPSTLPASNFVCWNKSPLDRSLSPISSILGAAKKN